MVNYACAFCQSEIEKYFEWIINYVTCCTLDKLVYLGDNFSIGPKPQDVSINSTATFTELY